MIYGFQIGIGTALISIGMFVLFHAPGRLVNRLFCLFSSGLGAWSIFLALLLSTENFFYNQFVLYCELPIFYGLFLFSCVYPNRHILPRFALLCGIPIVLVTAFSSTGAYISGFTHDINGSIEPVNGPYISIFAATAIVYFSASIYILVRHLRGAYGRERVQLWYVLLGIGISAAGTAFGDGLLPALDIFSFISLGSLSSIVMVGLIAYAIVRHQLMDIRIVIQRGLIYSVLLGLLVGSYLVSLNMLEVFVEEDHNATFMSALLMTIVGLSTAPKLERYFRRHTDKIFFKEKYDYAEASRRLSEGLALHMDIDELISTCEANLETIFKAERVIILPEGRKALGAVLIVPIALEGDILYSIALGPKRSGDPYTQEDKHLLETFALQATTALSRATLYTQVKKHALELEYRVEQRTHQLKNLQEEQKRLLLDISHNLQTPLTVLQTRLDQLKTKIPSDKTIPALEDSVSNVSRFISDLLRLARLENTHYEEEVSINLSSLVEEILEEVRIVADGHGIRVAYAGVPNITIRGNPQAIREAILCLADNSIKYMRQDSDRLISISLTDKSSNVLLALNDTGVGISQEDIPRIFKRFWRSAKNLHTAGNGLGLSFVKNIIEGHGGAVTAESVLGIGTTITISLPLGV